MSGFRTPLRSPSLAVPLNGASGAKPALSEKTTATFRNVELKAAS